MTNTTEATPLSYAGEDSTDDFAITWKYFAKAHIVATLRDSAAAETVQVLDTDYTLTAAGDTGTLTMTTPPATDETLVITLEPPNTQLSDIPVGGNFPASTVEDALDLASQRDSSIEALFGRALRVPKTDTQSASDLELPIDSDRASKFLAFNASGDPMASAGPVGTIPLSDFMGTVLVAETATAAREILQSQGQNARSHFNFLNGFMLQQAKGTDAPSASVMSFPEDGNYYEVSGTTTITDFDPLAKGTVFRIRFLDSLILTHGTNKLVLPGAANITTQAGDEAEFINGDGPTGARAWICTRYTRYDGRSLLPAYTMGTAQSTVSGTDITFAGIPAGTKRIAIMFSGVSLSGADDLIIQLGDAGGIETGGYFSGSSVLTSGVSSSNNTSAIGVEIGNAGYSVEGIIELMIENVAANRWKGSGVLGLTGVAGTITSAGRKTLTAELTQLKISVTGGAFDGGEINIMYE